MLFRNMRRFGSRRPARSSRSLGFVGLLSLCGASGELACVRAGSMTTPPETWAAQSDLLLRGPQDATEELRVLDAWSKTSSPQSEIARLGRLYDLFDCARFTQSALVREVFWTGLTGDVHVANRGKAATVAALEEPVAPLEGDVGPAPSAPDPSAETPAVAISREVRGRGTGGDTGRGGRVQIQRR